MTPLAAVAWSTCLLAAIPAAIAAANLPLYRPPPRRTRNDSPRPALSILIPARNEARAIGPALDSVLATPTSEADLEVVVLDDHSTDDTADVVRTLAARDPRVRLIAGAPLPPGWCGKQHACWQLAQAARHPILVFLDADVRLSPDGPRRLAGFLERHPSVQLASGVPRQFTGTFLERLLIPLIHLVLLGYLPLPAARRSRWTAFAAGCGQLFVARRDAYFAAGGHRAIRATLHDGVKLPRAFRTAGFVTDLFDATPVATCRMYDSGPAVWRGLAKNATEGLAHPAAIGPWSMLLLGGHVLPFLGLVAAPWLPPEALNPILAAVGLSWSTRFALALAYRQSLLGAFLHPLGVALLVLVQWAALFDKWRGQPMEWRGRSYPHPANVPRGNAATP
jgi:hypothetical protein